MANQNLHIDDLFLRGLNGYTEVPPGDVWNALEQRLDNRSKKRPFGWWRITLLLLATATGAYFGADLLRPTMHGTASTTSVTAANNTPATTTVNNTSTTKQSTSNNSNTGQQNVIISIQKTNTITTTKKEEKSTTPSNDNKNITPAATVSGNKKKQHLNDTVGKQPVVTTATAAKKQEATTKQHPVKNVDPLSTTITTPSKPAKKKNASTELNNTNQSATAVTKKQDSVKTKTIAKKEDKRDFLKDDTIPPTTTSAKKNKSPNTEPVDQQRSTTSQNPIRVKDKLVKNDEKKLVITAPPVQTIEPASQLQINTTTPTPTNQQFVTTPPVAATTEQQTTSQNSSNKKASKPQKKNKTVIGANNKQQTISDTESINVPVAANSNKKKTRLPISATTNKQYTPPADIPNSSTMSTFKDSSGKERHPLKYEAGLKAAYNVGTKAFSMSGFVISAYVKLSLSEKISLLFQPGIQLNHFGNGPFNEPGLFIDDHSTIVPTSSSGSWNRYNYTMAYDSIVIKHGLDKSSSTAFELPILLNFNITDQFSVYAGPAFAFGSIPKITQDKAIYTQAPILKHDSVLNPSTITLDDEYAKYHNSPKYSNYDSSQFQNPGNSPVHTSLMVGISYMADDKLQLNFSIHTNMSSLGFIPNDNIRTLYSQTYIRLGIGYKLFSNKKKAGIK